MLTIAARDRSTVNRKNKTAWKVQLPARLPRVATNCPRCAMSPLRWCPLHPADVTKSWLGQEDPGLGARLTTPRSLSSILNWALDGLDRLHKKGTFTMPAGADEALAELDSLASPETAWAEDHCSSGLTSGRRRTPCSLPTSDGRSRTSG